MFSDKRIIEFDRLRRGSRRNLRDLKQVGNVLLFLQAPIGAMGKELLIAARDAGFNPVKVDFNGGDRLFSKTKYSISFQGKFEDWDSWIASLLDGVRPVGVVLMGDMRPIHQVAINRAREIGIPVFCLEEGYIRPNFITLEPDGVNANSPLRLEFLKNYRRDPEHYVKQAALPDTVRHIGNEMLWAVSSVIRYYTAKLFGNVRYRYYQHHRDRPVMLESVLWTRGYFIKLLRNSYNKSKSLELIEHCEGRYFMIALQVADDLQLRSHGRKWTNQTLITRAIGAFAQSAPEDRHLVVKGHPLDRGRYNYRDLVRKIAKLHDCEQRVHYVDDGSISLLLRHSCGLVTINSTSGLSALYHVKPILALGDAIYSIEGLVNSSAGDNCIERFFANPVAPDRQMAQAFLDAIRRTVLVNGSFYHRGALRFTASNIIGRVKQLLERKTVATPDFGKSLTPSPDGDAARKSA